MTPHQALVIYSGLAFFVAGLFTLGIWRMLSPADGDRITVGWIGRVIVFLHALACVGRGITLIFPGRLVAVEHMSAMVPIAASTTLLVAGLVAELLQRNRLPPPLMARVMRALRAFREENAHGLADLAMAGPVASLSEPPAAEAAAVRLSSPKLRRVVLLAAGLGLLIVLVCVLRAAAAPLGAAQ